MMDLKHSLDYTFHSLELSVQIFGWAALNFSLHLSRTTKFVFFVFFVLFCFGFLLVFLDKVSLQSPVCDFWSQITDIHIPLTPHCWI